ncbi:MAG TPA: hypothetical protein VFZ21_15660 [Gemmatimonadaceae bacterium]|nr:hypothetical protein [Gemmatimonadaceae bacterium]
MTPVGAVLAVALAIQGGRAEGRPAAPPAADSTAARDGWFGADKIKHFFVAAFTQSVAYSALQAARVRHDRALVGAWVVTAAASVAKEVHDRKTTGRFSVRDLVWDAAGAGAASVVLASARRSASEPDSPPMQAAARRAVVAAPAR